MRPLPPLPSLPLNVFYSTPWALALVLMGCFFSGEEENRQRVQLSGTDLVGHYNMVNYLFEYGDGQVLNPTVLKLEGKLFLEQDSSFLERIWVENVPTDTKGKITQVWLLNKNRRRGEIALSLALGDSTQSGTSQFSYLGDTLILTTSVPKERDPLKKGFKETVSWLRDSLP